MADTTAINFVIAVFGLLCLQGEIYAASIGHYDNEPNLNLPSIRNDHIDSDTIYSYFKEPFEGPESIIQPRHKAISRPKTTAEFQDNPSLISRRNINSHPIYNSVINSNKMDQHRYPSVPPNHKPFLSTKTHDPSHHNAFIGPEKGIQSGHIPYDGHETNVLSRYDTFKVSSKEETLPQQNTFVSSETRKQPEYRLSVGPELNVPLEYNNFQGSKAVFSPHDNKYSNIPLVKMQAQYSPFAVPETFVLSKYNPFLKVKTRVPSSYDSLFDPEISIHNQHNPYVRPDTSILYKYNTIKSSQADVSPQHNHFIGPQISMQSQYNPFIRPETSVLSEFNPILASKTRLLSQYSSIDGPEIGVPSHHHPFVGTEISDLHQKNPFVNTRVRPLYDVAFPITKYANADGAPLHVYSSRPDGAPLEESWSRPSPLAVAHRDVISPLHGLPSGPQAESQMELDALHDVRQSGTSLSGIFGSGLGDSLSPYLGKLGSTLGTFLGPIVSQLGNTILRLISSIRADTRLSSSFQDSQDTPPGYAPDQPMKAYVATFPEYGDYIVLLEPEVYRSLNGKRGVLNHRPNLREQDLENTNILESTPKTSDPEAEQIQVQHGLENNEKNPSNLGQRSKSLQDNTNNPEQSQSFSNSEQNPNILDKNKKDMTENLYVNYENIKTENDWQRPSLNMNDDDYVIDNRKSLVDHKEILDPETSGNF